jgi:hypothetical protein
MTSDVQLQEVQNKIGKVQDQMRDNMEAVMRRKEDIEGISSKSANLQASASQFSQVATRIRKDQMMQIYRFYTLLILGFIAIGVSLTFWDSPKHLLIGLGLIAITAGLALYLFKRWKEGSVAMADSIEAQGIVDLEAERNRE